MSVLPCVFLVSMSLFLSNIGESNGLTIIQPTPHEEMTKEELLAEIGRLLKELSKLQHCDACYSLPCQNGGTCNPTNNSGYSCACPENTTGTNCEIILVCTATSCPVNTDCSVSNHQIVCTCKNGFIKHLQNECVPEDICKTQQPCQNSGICELLQPTTAAANLKTYRCLCPDNTAGENCEELLECPSPMCGENTDCFIRNHQINCVCKLGYTIDEQGNCTVKTRQACMWGDPHYTTFDGLMYDYQGTCPYVVSQPCDNVFDMDPYFSVRAQNGLYDLNARWSAVTWAELTIYGHSFQVHQNLTLTVDGATTNVPYEFYLPNEADWRVKAEVVSGIMRITTPERIEVSYYPYTLCVEVPEKLVVGTGRLCGLFGDIDNACQNDFRGMSNNLIGIPNATCIWPRDGTSGPAAEKFGDSWVYDFQGGNCIPGGVMSNTSLPCQPDEYMAAKQACQAIELAKSGRGIFAKCVALGAKRLDELFNGCAYDACADKELRCNALTDFVRTCQQAIPGTILSGWRTNVSCPLVCPASQVYSECVSGCQTTCANNETTTVCNKPCIEGCTCSYGTVLDGSGLNCVPQEECGCTHNGVYAEAGSAWMNADCSKAFKCMKSSKLIIKDIACGARATCSFGSETSQCQCIEGSSGTCKTPEQTIIDDDPIVCDCK